MSFYDRNTYNREERTEIHTDRRAIANRRCPECGALLMKDRILNNIYCEECERQEEENNNDSSGT